MGNTWDRTPISTEEHPISGELPQLGAHRDRNAVGRTFCKLEGYRRTATAMTNSAIHILAAVFIVASVIRWLRVRTLSRR